MKTAWIVDDDDEMRRAMSLFLAMLEFDTRPFHRARPAAQELLHGKRPDILILDISMPDVTGIMMLEFIRRRPEWNDLPIIMLSAEATDIQVDEALNLGADGYIKKPVSLDEMEAAIHSAMAKHKK